MSDGLLMSGGNLGTIRVWDWKAGNCLTKHRSLNSEGVNHLVELRDGSIAYTTFIFKGGANIYVYSDGHTNKVEKAAACVNVDGLGKITV